MFRVPAPWHRYRAYNDRNIYHFNLKNDIDPYINLSIFRVVFFSICSTVIVLNIGFTLGLINKKNCLVCKTEQTYQHFRHWFWQRTRAYPNNYTLIKHYRNYWVVFILIIESLKGILLHAFFTFNGFLQIKAE